MKIGSHHTIETRTQQRESHIVHGRSYTPMYKIWTAMSQRCYNPLAIGYEHYGGRGITVCDRWRESFENFLADMGERPEGLSLDRIDNDGNYGPHNCRWATAKEQIANQRCNGNCKCGGERA